MKYEEEGRAAYHYGKSRRDGPYADAERDSRWVKGWFAAERDRLLSIRMREPLRYLEAQLSFL